MSPIFQIVCFDGYHLGFRDAFVQTFLDFDELEDAQRIAIHFEDWIAGGE